MIRDYFSCTIEIGAPATDGMPLTLRAPAGDYHGRFAPGGELSRLPFDQLGRRLFDTLFAGEARELFERSLALLGRNQGLRLVFMIAPEAVEAAALPWEALADDEHGPLALGLVSVVRAVSRRTAEPLPVSPPLRVLLSAAHTPPLVDVDRELEAISTSLGELNAAGLVTITLVPHLTANALQRHLRDEYHIWHFVGHGGTDARGRPALLLEDANGDPEPFDAGRLAVMLRGSSVRLALLSACDSGRAAGAFQSLAPALVHAECPAVVAMQRPVSAETTRSFASEFYRALAEGLALDSCTAEGRKAVMNSAGLEHADWTLPVVYTSAADGRLFDLPPLAAADGRTISRTAALAADVGQGLALPYADGRRGAELGVNSNGGTIVLEPGPIVVRPNPAAPRAMLPVQGFRGRTQELETLRQALLPRRGVWLHGAAGCGLSATLRQGASDITATRLRNGVLLLDGENDLTRLDERGDVVPVGVDDIAQQIFEYFHTATDRVTGMPLRIVLGPNDRSLHELQALVAIDRAPLSQRSLTKVRDRLPNCAFLACGDGPAPETLVACELGRLERPEAIALLAAAQRLADDPGDDTELQRVCAALGDLPLPLVLAGKLVAAGITTLAQLAEELERPAETARDGANRPPRPSPPLDRLVRTILAAIAPEEREVLASIARAGARTVDLDQIIAVSGALRPVALEALEWLARLGLVYEEDGAYRVASFSLQRAMDRLLPAGEQRATAAAFVAGTALARPGDIGWLAAHQQHILSAAETLLTQGKAAEAGALARTLQPALTLNGRWNGWEQTIDIAEQAATATGDRSLQAWAFHERGTHTGLAGDPQAARDYLTAARDLRLTLGDQAGAAASTHNLAYLRLLPPILPPPVSDPTSDTTPRSTTRRWPKLPLALLVILPLLLVPAVLWGLTRQAPPIALAASPADGSYPLDVTFSAGDADAGTYTWDFGDGQVLTGTQHIVTHRYVDVGSYTAFVVMQSQFGAPQRSSATVTVRNTPPSVSIAEPAKSALFGAGEVLVLRGEARDPETSGILDGDALRWHVALREGDTRRVLLDGAQGASAAVSIPSDGGADATLEIELIATDERGAVARANRVLQPALVDVTLGTEPAGLSLVVDGVSRTTPFSVTRWRGQSVRVDMLEQSQDGKVLVFAGWSDGATVAARIIPVDRSNSRYVARFLPITAALATGELRAVEGEDATLLVRLDAPSTQPLELSYTMGGGTATPDADYSPGTGQLVFKPGETERPITITPRRDGLDEPDETLFVRLTDTGRTVLGAPSSATVTIADADTSPVAAIQGDLRVPEGATATATVTLSASSAVTVTVDYRTADESARAAEGDYSATAGQLSFAPGEISKTFAVAIGDDALDEAEEGVLLQLTAANGAQPGTGARIVIEDNDEAPFVRFAARQFKVQEGQQATVTVMLTAPSGQLVTARLVVEGGSATPGADFVVPDQRIEFQPGETSKTISVQTIDDDIYESINLVLFSLRDPSGALAGDLPQTSLAITDNDPLPVLSFTAPDITVSEAAGEFVIDVRLDRVSEEPVTAVHAAGQILVGKLEIPPGQIGVIVRFQFQDDAVRNADLVFRLELFDVVGATLGKPAVTVVTITDDDPLIGVPRITRLPVQRSPTPPRAPVP